ncbi:MAG: class I SAM-dependent methyltransferase [bacterium]
MIPTTELFTGRAKNYARYRPSYPREIIDVLVRECQLCPSSIVADIGSGTGILSRLFLDFGSAVFGVEPNQEMRQAAEKILKDYPSFKSVAGTAEATTLKNASVDFITAGQAFHWFDASLAWQEFPRILKPKGWVVLLWNGRCKTTPFLKAYEKFLLTLGKEGTIDTKGVAKFFGGNFSTKKFQHSQTLDCEGLKGYFLSRSYAPQKNHPSYLPTIKTLQALFEQHQINNRVTFEHETVMYYSRL